MAYGRELEAENAETSTTVLLEEVVIDPGRPTITIKRAQMHHINSLNKYSGAIIYLMDCLFDAVIYRGLCYGELKKNFHDQVGAIENFIEAKFTTIRKRSISRNHHI